MCVCVCVALGLTGAAESLFSQSDQHVQTQVAVGWFVEVLQSPHVLSVIFHVLHKHHNDVIDFFLLLMGFFSPKRKLK